MSKRATERDVYTGSGNVFADLNVPNPEEALAKARLASTISDIIDEQKLTQAQAAKLMGVDQPKVSAIVRGRLAEFSIERLLRFVLLLGRDVDIAVKKTPRSRQHARVRVLVA
jgi:predicted XRE-type DNA-binding protein